ncbi:MAG: electron transfer flavoprotein subunit beta/FixA family protein [Thermoplasmataceae archaeon]|jgi:electron transfer flavoprotein beta subunit
MAYQIIVLAKQMPDLELIKPDPNTGEPVLKGVSLRFETLSKNAVEAAIRIKEKFGGKITVITYGNETATQVIKEAYAMGADEGILLTGYPGNNPLNTATVLAEKIKKIPHDLVLLGNQSADSYTGLLPGMLSYILGEPLLGSAVSIDLKDRTVEVLKVLDSNNEKIQAALPAIVSVTQEINEPRLPPVMQILAAGRKPITTEKVTAVSQYSRIISNRAPKSERKHIIFEDMDKGVPEVAKAMKEAIR